MVMFLPKREGAMFLVCQSKRPDVFFKYLTFSGIFLNTSKRVKKTSETSYVKSQASCLIKHIKV